MVWVYLTVINEKSLTNRSFMIIPGIEDAIEPAKMSEALKLFFPAAKNILVNKISLDTELKYTCKQFSKPVNWSVLVNYANEEIDSEEE